MASKRRSKGKKGSKAMASAISPNVVIAAAQGATETKPSPRKKPAKPTRRKARRVRPRKPAPEVAARAVASEGGRRIRIDRATRKRAQRLVTEVRKRKQRATRDFYAMGKALRELSDRRMHTALGYEAFKELLADQELVSRSTAFKLMAVVEAYPREQALELGLEKAYGLVQWSRAAGTEETPSELVDADVLIGNQRVREITTRGLADNAKRMREKLQPTDGRVASRKQAERIARGVQRELRAQGLASAQARARRVRGRWQVQVDAMADDAAAWLEAE